ncbi:MAG TPA: potassium transporter TrkG, partial [Gemmatimonadales bacterium]|nr:potassium transporter TrkG [Gemmatimonadales bacterium]
VLRLPLAHAPEAAIGWLDALFTATSAVCVTGLIVVDTGRDFSPFGQAAIALLIQMGGLGILTVGMLLALVTGRRLGFRERMNLQTQLSALHVGGVVRLVHRVLVVVLGIELIGAVLLYPRMAAAEGWRLGAWQAAFHAVSAFNNAGFSLYADSLTRYAGDPLVNLVVLMLIVVGGLGFVVVVNLITRQWQGRRAPLSLHQVSRYRDPASTPRERRVDESFWARHQGFAAGGTADLLTCATSPRGRGERR